jgi:dipeptidyl aminopeptidase/acylaminoacyl peptidase
VKNVYRLHVGTGKQTRLTDLPSDVDFADLTMVGSERYLVVSAPGPLKTTIYRYDLAKDTPSPEKVLEEPQDIRILDLDHDTLLLKKTSAVLPILIEDVKLSAKPPRGRPLAGLGEEVVKQVVHADVEAVLFDTFDDISLTLGGETLKGKLHAMLYTPKKPLPREDRLVLIQSMYGGENQFDPDIQILCEAGIHVFSPAPRGSYMFSAAIEQANDGDMGGKEILDVIYAAKYISKRLNVPPSRVGAFGHSHGGYATLRLLTFPAEFNGLKSDFGWGFGISQSGFSSVANLYAYSNVKQWVAKEAGDPGKPGIKAQWEARSPVNHVKHLRGRLLLIHGTSDERVPFGESQTMYDRLVDAGLGERVRLVPIDGAGHAYTKNRDRVRMARETFSFLETIP